MDRPLRVHAIDDAPVAEIRYLNAARGGGTVVERLPITIAHVGRLADDLDGIVVCSDLQGIVRGHGDAAELLGVHVVDAIDELSAERALPPIARMGAILAGDLYAVPGANKRGGYGDVADVWAAFAARFAWVAGVAGNHDDVTHVPDIGANVYLLDGEVAIVDDIRIGGVAGIISAKQRPWRRPEEVQLAQLERAVEPGIDILVLHEGPDGSDDQPGNPTIRAALEALDVSFTICGHDHWHDPLAHHAAGQVVNVDARVLVLVAGSPHA